MNAQTGNALMTDKTTGRYCNAKLNYMSRHSMYFKVDGAFKSGNIIDLQFDSPPLGGVSKNYHGTVCWCMLLSEDEPIPKYGVGIKYSKLN
jgi:hypothetical protein